MSSLRNAVKRHTHKERSQPARRKKLGLLEKKKDYKQRANDFQKKRKQLKKLHQKAAFKNEDEFYFKMINTKTKGGVHQIEREKVSDDVVKLVRTQNMSYLQLKDNEEQREIDKLRGSLHFLETSKKPQNTHTLFFDDEEEAREFDKAEFFETTRAFADRTFNRPKKSVLKNESILVAGDESSVQQAMKRRERSYLELDARLRRKEKIKSALDHMTLYKNLSGKGARKKIKDGINGRPPVYRWKQERKR